MDGGAKKTLGVIAGVIGVITATVGLMKECAPESGAAPVYQQQPVYQQPAPQPVYQQPVQQPVYSSTCCTTAGNCMMMDGAQLVGAQCFCFNAFGQMAPGTVCQ
jgi:hypothetical protein